MSYQFNFSFNIDECKVTLAGLELNDMIADIIKKDLVKVLQLLDIVMWGLVFVGSLLTGASLINYLYKRKNMVAAMSSSVPTVFKSIFY